MLIGTLFLFSCKDPLIGEDNLLTSTDNFTLQKVDSLDFLCYSLADTSRKANGLSPQLLGSIHDDNFGDLFTGVYSTLSLSTNNVDLGSSLVLDSCILSLDFSGHYGNFDQPMQLLVFEMDELMSSDAEYKSDRSFTVKTPEIGSLSSYTPNFTDSVSDVQGKYKAHIRIPLSTSFGQNLLNQSNTSNFSETATFQAFLKGFYITTNSSTAGDGIIYLNLASSLSRLSLYYSNAEHDSLRYDFPLGDDNVHVNHYFSSLGASPASVAISHANTAGGDSLIYLEGANTTKAFIKINGIDSSMSVLVNFAQLWVFPVEESPEYALPSRLYLSKLIDLDESVLTDALESSSVSGLLTEEVIDGETRKLYKFNLTRYAQRLIDGEIDNDGLIISAYPRAYTADRVVLGGSGHSKYAPQFRMIATQKN